MERLVSEIELFRQATVTLAYIFNGLTMLWALGIQGQTRDEKWADC